MRITTDGLGTATEEPAAPITPAFTPPPVTEAPLNTPKPFPRSEIDLFQFDPEEILPQNAVQLLKQTEYTVATSLGRAMQLRQSGVRAISVRELDIAIRGSLIPHLIADSAIDTMLMFMDSILCEGIVGLDNNPWELRSRYNRGLNYIKNTTDETNLAKAKVIMKSIEAALVRHNLPVRKEEQVSGFHICLTHPEWMTKAKYMHHQKQRRVIAESDPQPTQE